MELYVAGNDLRNEVTFFNNLHVVLNCFGFL